MSDLSGLLVPSIGIALIVYASTNIDDLLILAVFFADPRVRVGAVIVGRFIGLAALVLASGACALLALVIPAEWIALLGLLPLLLGLRALRALRTHRDDESSVEALSAAAAKNKIQHSFSSQSFTVAGVTLANGGDNLSIYIPLFASAPHAVGIYVAVFAVMTALWCALGYLVVNNPLFGSQVRRYGHLLLPVVLIALGVYILAGAAPLVR